MNFIQTSQAPSPGGHYSQAVEAGGWIFISGQLPVNPETGEKVLGSIEEQTIQVLHNVKAIAEAAGSDLSRIVKTTVYVCDIALWGRVNAVYADFFGANKPARAVVPTKELHHGFLIEMEAVVWKG